MTETDPWEPETTQAGTAPVITAEMTGTASMVIQRMYSSDDPGEVQSGRAVVQALYPLIAAAERRAFAAALRSEAEAMRRAKHEEAAVSGQLVQTRATERAYGAVDALDWMLTAIDRMTGAKAGSSDEPETKEG